LNLKIHLGGHSQCLSRKQDYGIDAFQKMLLLRTREKMDDGSPKLMTQLSRAWEISAPMPAELSCYRRLASELMPSMAELSKLTGLTPDDLTR
jgi:hypothetical protein